MERPGSGAAVSPPSLELQRLSGRSQPQGQWRGGGWGGDTVAAHEASERNRGSLEGTLSTSSFLSPGPCLPCVGSLLGAQARGAEAQPARRSRAGQKRPDPQIAVRRLPAGVAGSRARQHLPPSSFSLARTGRGRGALASGFDFSL